LSLCSRRPWTAAKSWMICRFPPGTECSSCHGTSLIGLRPASAGPRSNPFCFSGERSTRSCKLNPGEGIPDTYSVKSCILDETNFYCSDKDDGTRSQSIAACLQKSVRSNLAQCLFNVTT
jgi:hypothetical protein